MAKRSKENSEYWDKRTNELLKMYPEYRKTAKRFEATCLILQERYPIIKEQRELLARLLKDADFIERKLRLKTEGEEDDLKELLEQEYIVENLQ